MRLEDGRAARIIRQAGNSGEGRERNITPSGVPRGIDSLWTMGGLQHAPPIR